MPRYLLLGVHQINDFVKSSRDKSLDHINGYNDTNSAFFSIIIERKKIS